MKAEKTMNVEKAEALVLEQARQTASATVPLLRALGLVTSEDVRAPMDIPHFSMSTMDGYALQSGATGAAASDRPVRLAVIGDVRAGMPAGPAIGGEQAVRIMTGGILPPGADAVVRLEDCSPADGTVAVLRTVGAGDNVRLRGSDKKRGEPVIPKGKSLRAIDVEALASMGIQEVPVHRRPTVSIINTGDELVAISDPLGDGKLVQSNGHLLAARARELDAGYTLHAPVPDSPDAIRNALRGALADDLIVITGGTADGDRDHVRGALRDMGTVLLHGVAIRPGRGFSFAVIQGKPVFSLPGNPSACLVLFELFIKPCISKMLGKNPPPREASRARSLTRFPKSSDFRRYAGARTHSLRGRMFVSADGARAVGTLTPMIGQNSLAVVYENSTPIGPADTVDVLVLYPEDTEELPCESRLPEKFAGAAPAPVVSFVGKSNSGKTTLLEKTIRELAGRGYRIGSVKHDAHRFEIDSPGKDSFRHRAAGARVVAISSNDKVAVVENITSRRTLDEIVAAFGSAVDIVLTEGFRRGGKPKVEVCRSERSRELMCSADELLAVVSDRKFDLPVPQLGLDEIAALADLIEGRFLKR